MADEKQASAAASIDIFLRIRPSKQPRNYAIEEAGHRETGERINFKVPKELAVGEINNAKEEYNFKFGKVFDQNAKQDDIFDKVAVEAVTNALDGFNSTVFAYGQTGSGKTFTITGGAERYADRGLIPRALSHIYAECGKRHDRQHQIYVSYLELYNEAGYDLLDQSKETQKLEDLPRVTMQEDEDGNVHMRNLSATMANTEEEALNLLFIGDTNRMIAETPMNLASSRSHCIFTGTIESRGGGSDVIRRSKFNLVDLAGSERVHKTQAGGQLLAEAKYINLSLHYLEQVIVALSEKRTHIPYRNSMMTGVLRDSLGGNCKTAMIATISSELRNMDESISTCRFAQRVAMVKNEATINEQLDPQLMIKRLKQENKELREEIAMLKGEAVDRGDAELSDEERARLMELVRTYVADPSEDATLNVSEYSKLRATFKIFKTMLQEANARPGTGVASVALPGGAVISGGGTESGGADLDTLRLQLQQRDNEINILVAMLNKRQASGGGEQQGDSEQRGGGSAHENRVASLSARAREKQAGGRQVGTPTEGGGGAAGGQGQGAGSAARDEPPVKLHMLDGSAAEGGEAEMEQLVDTELLRDRNQSFEHFRKSYRKNEAIEENKAILKQKYSTAKGLAAQVNATRTRINSLKGTIEQLRKERAAQGLMDEGGGEPEVDPEEERAKAQIDEEKVNYKRGYAELKALKGEIEHLQLMLERSRKTLQKDFESWFSTAARQAVAREKADAVRASKGNGGSVAAVRASTLELGGGGGGGAVAETPRTAAARKAAGPMLTGNPQADADIVAFYKARDELQQRQGQAGKKH
jgi:kinesin family protein 6/9